MLLSVAVVVAVLCAGLMGYAIQRGATCTVAAVDELLNKRQGEPPDRDGRGVAVGGRWLGAGQPVRRIADHAGGIPGERVGVHRRRRCWGLGAWVERRVRVRRDRAPRLGGHRTTWPRRSASMWVASPWAHCSARRARSKLADAVAGAAGERRGGAAVRRLCRLAGRAAAGAAGDGAPGRRRARGGTARLVAACGHRRDRRDLRDHPAAGGRVGLHRRAGPTGARQCR